jgi:hypothetical protein
MSLIQPTWEPHEKHGQLTMRSDLPDTVYAFPKQRKEPLTDAQHVRNAVARFDQVLGASDEDRALAFANIEKAAQHYQVDLSETNWHQLGVHPQQHREESAAKAVETKRERSELKEIAAKAVETKREHGVLKAAAAKAAATRQRGAKEPAEEFSENEEF